MPRCRIFDRIQRDRRVEGRQPPTVRDRKREQIDVGNLAMPLNMIPMKPTRVAHANRIRPENVLPARTKGSQTRSCVLQRSASPGISRIREQAYQRILCHRAGGPTAAAIAAEPKVSRFVVNVSRIKQRNQNVWVEESDHKALWFVAQPIHNFRSHYARPSSFGQERHPIAPARGLVFRRERSSGQLRKNSPGRSSPLRREFLGALQHVLVDIECGSHRWIITHQTSDVKRTRTYTQGAV